jgi:hypothetical protein
MDTSGPTVEVDAGAPVSEQDAGLAHGADPVDEVADGSDTEDGSDTSDTTPPPSEVHHHHDHGHTVPDGTGDPTETPDEPSGGGYAWADGASQPFNGSYVSGDFHYAMTFNLQRSGSAVSGTIFVVCEAAPDDQSELVGRSAMEWVSGSYTPSSGALTLTGSNTTDESVWTAGRYRLTLSASGAVRGAATGDGGRITGQI